MIDPFYHSVPYDSEMKANYAGLWYMLSQMASFYAIGSVRLPFNNPGSWICLVSIIAASDWIPSSKQSSLQHMQHLFIENTLVCHNEAD